MVWSLSGPVSRDVWCEGCVPQLTALCAYSSVQRSELMVNALSTEQAKPHRTPRATRTPRRWWVCPLPFLWLRACAYVQLHQIVYVKYVWFGAYKLYVNKDEREREERELPHLLSPLLRTRPWGGVTVTTVREVTDLPKVTQQVAPADCPPFGRSLYQATS